MPVVRSAESVYIGHPDKLCDLIADHILDDILTRDPAARVAIEVNNSGLSLFGVGEWVRGWWCWSGSFGGYGYHVVVHRRPATA